MKRNEGERITGQTTVWIIVCKVRFRWNEYHILIQHSHLTATSLDETPTLL